MSDSVLIADDQPVDPDDELLVAYLDDELGDDERKSVEERLVGEVEFQRRLQSLQSGWEWLDELPGEAANEHLVESTIELAVEDLVPTKRKQATWIKRHAGKLGFVAILVVAFVSGGVGKRMQSKLALRHDLDELAIAEHHEAYKLGDDFSLYRQLMYDQRWQGMIETMERVGQREMMAPVVVDVIPREQRSQSLQELPTQTREKLLGRWETYNAYSDETKAKMRVVAEKVHQTDDSEKLLQTMKAASVWLEGLHEEVRDRIQSTDQEVRNEAISQAIDVTLMDLGRESGKLISDNTAGRIYLWLQVLFEQRMDENETLKERIDQWSKFARESEYANEAFVEYYSLRMMVDDFDPRGRVRGPWPGFSSGFRGPGGPGPGGPGPGGTGPGGPGQGGPGQGGPGPGNGGPGKGGPGNAGPGPGRPGEPRVGDGGENGDPGRRMPLPIRPITDDEYRTLKNDILSAKARADLDSLTSLSTELSGDDEGPVNAILRLWAIESVRRNRPMVDQELTPLDRYREHEDRDELDLMPPEAIMSEIYRRPENRSWQQRRGRD